MPETFTITAVGDTPRKWDSDQYGSFHIWPVKYSTALASGEAERKVKADSAKPTVGESFEGELKERPGYASELKKLPKQHGGGGGRAPMSPAKEAEIRRLACQKSAVALLVAEVSMGNEKPGTVSELLKKRIDWLEEDCIAAGKAAA